MMLESEVDTGSWPKLVSSSSETFRSTKNQSKQRRDLINSEINALRDALPLPKASRLRLSQLQLMACVNCFIRKSNYYGLEHLNPGNFINEEIPGFQAEFGKAMPLFILMCERNGKLMYVGDNTVDYLGQSLEDLLAHGDSLYEIVFRDDHSAIKAALETPLNDLTERLVLCRVNAARSMRRQGKFGEHKMIIIRGKYVKLSPTSPASTFLASCTPILTPDNREVLLHTSTSVMTGLLSHSMEFIGADTRLQNELGYRRKELAKINLYSLIHNDDLNELRAMHQNVINTDGDQASGGLIRIRTNFNTYLYVHALMMLQTPISTENTPNNETWTNATSEFTIVFTCQLLTTDEALIFERNHKLLYAPFSNDIDSGYGGSVHNYTYSSNAASNGFVAYFSPSTQAEPLTCYPPMAVTNYETRQNRNHMNTNTYKRKLSSQEVQQRKRSVRISPEVKNFNEHSIPTFPTNSPQDVYPPAVARRVEYSQTYSSHSYNPTTNPLNNILNSNQSNKATYDGWIAIEEHTGHSPEHFVPTNQVYAPKPDPLENDCKETPYLLAALTAPPLNKQVMESTTNRSISTTQWSPAASDILQGSRSSAAAATGVTENATFGLTELKPLGLHELKREKWEWLKEMDSPDKYSPSSSSASPNSKTCDSSVYSPNLLINSEI